MSFLVGRDPFQGLFNYEGKAYIGGGAWRSRGEIPALWRGRELVGFEE